MHPSGVTRHLASGTAITFGKTFRRGEPPLVAAASALFSCFSSPMIHTLVLNFLFHRYAIGQKSFFLVDSN